MSTVLTYGLEKPETGDTGGTFFTQVAAAIQRVDDHTHDGSDSALIDSSSIDKASVTAVIASWALVSNGIYRQSVACPAGRVCADVMPIAKASATGEVLYLTILPNGAATFWVYSNDNTIDVEVFFLT